MLPARAVGRTASASARRFRVPQLPTSRQARFQSSSSGNAGSSVTLFAAGAAGGLVAGGIIYAAYLLSPAGRMARQVNTTFKEAAKKYDEATQKLQEKTPDVGQTVNLIKQYCYSYATWIPGGRQYVDTVFKDIDIIREKHREEVDKILSDAYKQLQQGSKSGFSLEAVSRGYDVVADVSKRLAGLAGDAFTDVLDNHPAVKDKFGGSIDQLKTMGEQYGPEAKKIVDDTWHQAQDVLKGGFSMENVNKARKLLQDKVEQVKKLGDEAWKKGLEQAKPHLDKNPKLKELIEKNGDALRQGNVKELFEKAKKAVESGDTGAFEEYVKSAVDKAKSSGSKASKSFGLDQYFDIIPHGSEIVSTVKQLKEVAEKYSEEGEALLQETAEELKKVLEKKSQKAQAIVEKAKKDTK